jgi:hypothetical protein
MAESKTSVFVHLGAQLAQAFGQFWSPCHFAVCVIRLPALSMSVLLSPSPPTQCISLNPLHTPGPLTLCRRTASAALERWCTSGEVQGNTCGKRSCNNTSFCALTCSITCSFRGYCCPFVSLSAKPLTEGEGQPSHHMHPVPSAGPAVTRVTAYQL